MKKTLMIQAGLVVLALVLLVLARLYQPPFTPIETVIDFPDDVQWETADRPDLEPLPEPEATGTAEPETDYQ